MPVPVSDPSYLASYRPLTSFFRSGTSTHVPPVGGGLLTDSSAKGSSSSTTAFSMPFPSCRRLTEMPVPTSLSEPAGGLYSQRTSTWPGLGSAPWSPTMRQTILAQSLVWVLLFLCLLLWCLFLWLVSVGL